MDKIKPLFTATAMATGGRNGHTELSDAVVAADLSLPKEMADQASLEQPHPSISLPPAMPRALAVPSTLSASSISRSQARPR